MQVSQETEGENGRGEHGLEPYLSPPTPQEGMGKVGLVCRVSLGLDGLNNFGRFWAIGMFSNGPLPDPGEGGLQQEIQGLGM